MTLSQRIAALEGPDRAVDAEVAVALGYRVIGEGHPLGTQCYDESGVSVPLPRFTASLDAAMTVVPEGFHWALSSPGLDAEKEDLFAAVVAEMPGDPVDLTFAPTPALALLAAAMQARGL